MIASEPGATIANVISMLVIDPFSEQGSMLWLLWLLPAAIFAFLAWYLYEMRHQALDPRRRTAWIIALGLVSFASITKFVHELDVALSPIGIGGAIVIVIVAYFVLADPAPPRRW